MNLYSPSKKKRGRPAGSAGNQKGEARLEKKKKGLASINRNHEASRRVCERVAGLV